MEPKQKELWEELKRDYGLDFTTRSMQILIRADKDEQIRAVFSTEQPVEVLDWEKYRVINEILVADGMKAADQIPMLDNHDRHSNGSQSVIGSGTKMTVEAREDGFNQIVGNLDFSASSEKAQGVKSLVDEKHVRAVSVGYRVRKHEDIEVGAKASVGGREVVNNGQQVLYNGHTFEVAEALPVRVSYEWEVKEISTTIIGADSLAKIRSAMKGAIKPEPVKEPEGRVNPVVDVTPKKDEPRMELTKEQKDAELKQVRTDELTRATEIRAIASQFSYVEGVEKRANDAIEKGTVVDVFRLDVTNGINAALKERGLIDSKSGALDLSPKDAKRWSLMNIVRAKAENNPEVAAFERDVSEAAAKLMGIKPRGIIMPADVLQRSFDQRTRDALAKRAVTVAGTGSNLVPTEHMAANYIDLLRNQSMLLRAGAQSLTGLVGDVDIPKLTGGATFEHLTSETDTVTASDPTFATVALSPSEGGAQVVVSRKLQKQSDPSVDALIMATLFADIATGIDLNGITGDGTAGAPTGILNFASVGDVTGTTFDWDAAVEFETDVLAANAGLGTMAFLIGAAVNGALKTRVKVATHPVFINENNEINGYPVLVTNQVPAATMVFGAYNQLILGLWGAVDLIVDRATQAASGSLVLTAFQDYDWASRHDAAFSKTENFT